jgi:hypothetical protein
VRRLRTRRLQAFSLGIGASVLALFAVGCPEPADLANPQDFPTAAGTSTGTAGSTGGGVTAGTGGMPASGASCESTCMASIIGTTCKACHGKALKIAGTLDLESAGYTDRLKGKPSEHPAVDASACPMGDKLIDTDTPANSWLLKKVSNQQGTCGTMMPASPPLTSDQLSCFQTYVSCVAGAK